MIVCHCNRIQAACIERSARELTASDPGRPPTPDEIYGLLGKSPCCRGCLPLAEAIISACANPSATGVSCCRDQALVLIAAE